MSTTRIIVLGLLSQQGPMHGHQLRRHIELVNLEAWGDVHPGALYGALHRMEGEGLIVPVRSEQPGRFPARTVYAITNEGRVELNNLRDRALQEARLAPDPFDVALSVADLSTASLETLIAQRRRTLQTDLDQQVSERQRLDEAGLLSAAHRAAFLHWEFRLRAELAFLDTLVPLLPQIVAEQHKRPVREIEELPGTTSIVPLEPSPRPADRRPISDH
jgi:DNA-binding PadR family transcriptional regulator